MKTIIVDDEPLARLGIRTLLQKHSDVEILAECANGKQAIAAISSKDPDLVFLDIQMPEMDGFAVLHAIDPEHWPYIIFVTAYDQYAVRAFEVHALDYLLKPVDEERFEKALSRARSISRNRRGQGEASRMQALLEELSGKKYPERLLIKENGRIYFIRINMIDWIESQGNYVMIHAGKASHLLRETISGLEERLDPAKFVRIHRSSIVNVDRIREMAPLFHGAYRVLLIDGTRLFLSRRYRDKVRDRLGL